ncbi:MAG: phage Gp37/Gp68 family protein, partial [Bryobacterales bacterium]|nr:phage Gp37/Gp68 family protein [Bryobacterales bacterium]
EFEWTHQTAYNFIRVYQKFGSKKFLETDFAPSALYLLSAPGVPEEVRQQAIEMADTGARISVKKAQELIAIRRLPEPEPLPFDDDEPEDDLDIDPNTGEILNADMPEYDDLPETQQEVKPMAKSAYITLAQWQRMNDAEKEIVLTPSLSKATFNNQKNDNIEWARWSWNPVTGCKHDCPYCYARDIANRFYEQGFEPSFLPDRLIAPHNTVVPPVAATDIGYKNVFACSMADLFGRWVPTEWIEAVLDAVRGASQWNFLFLTKFPIRLSEFDFPDNAWVGTTVDCQARVKNAENAFRRVKAKVKWLSCEPLLEPLEFNDLGMFQWIVLGGASGSTKTPEWHPPRAWINRIEDKARSVGCKVYEKTNLLERIREYPGYDAPAVRLPEALRYLPSIEVE